MSHPLDEQQWWGYVIIGQDKGKAVSKGRICETLHKHKVDTKHSTRSLGAALRRWSDKSGS